MLSFEIILVSNLKIDAYPSIKPIQLIVSSSVATVDGQKSFILKRMVVDRICRGFSLPPGSDDQPNIDGRWEGCLTPNAQGEKLKTLNARPRGMCPVWCCGVGKSTNMIPMMV